MSIEPACRPHVPFESKLLASSGFNIPTAANIIKSPENMIGR
jgi:hypothetical protein